MKMKLRQKNDSVVLTSRSARKVVADRRNAPQALFTTRPPT
jgi:hypothetical protein